MLRWRFGLCAIVAVVGCTTNRENAPAVPDAAGAIAESTTSPDPEATDPEATDPEAGSTTKPDGMQSDTSVGLESSDDTSSGLTSPSAPQTADDATSAVDDGGAGHDVSCDVRKLICKRAEPSCDYGRVPRIIDGCYAECVRIDACVCDGPDACPQHERYTCNNSRQRCTPYLN